MTALIDRALRPMVHTGDSANIAFYGERSHNGVRGVWCEVLRGLPWQRDTGGAVFVNRTLPVTYRFTIYIAGQGKVAEATVERPFANAPERLPTRTVARVVREALGAKAA
jgi:hypothetical protein